MNVAQEIFLGIFGWNPFWGSHGKNPHTRKAGPGRKAQASRPYAKKVTA